MWEIVFWNFLVLFPSLIFIWTFFSLLLFLYLSYLILFPFLELFFPVWGLGWSVWRISGAQTTFRLTVDTLHSLLNCTKFLPVVIVWLGGWVDGSILFWSPELSVCLVSPFWPSAPWTVATLASLDSQLYLLNLNNIGRLHLVSVSLHYFLETVAVNSNSLKGSPCLFPIYQRSLSCAACCPVSETQFFIYLSGFFVVLGGG